jgi:uncharacterized membrane protein YdjX (TVP38/TMEM64 family)
MFKTWIGCIASLIGCQFGIFIAVGLGRYLFNSPNNIASFTNNQPSFFAHFSRIEAHRLIHIVILLRIAPVVPFGLCNYLLSSTNMSLMHIMFASLIGNFPGFFIFIIDWLFNLLIYWIIFGIAIRP